MNGLDSAVDVSPLIGRQLIQLCFGAWNVAVIFDSEMRIVVESTIEVSCSTPAGARINDFRKGASLLCDSLGHEIVDAVRTIGGGLAIRFASGVQWTIENSVEDYESFQVHIGGQLFVA